MTGVSVDNPNENKSTLFAFIYSILYTIVAYKFLDESIRLAAFYDFGWFGDRYSSYDSDYFMSVGGGLVLKMPRYLSGNVYVGVPIVNRPEDASSVRVHFMVTSNIL